MDENHDKEMAHFDKLLEIEKQNHEQKMCDSKQKHEENMMKLRLEHEERMKQMDKT